MDKVPLFLRVAVMLVIAWLAAMQSERGLLWASEACELSFRHVVIDSDNPRDPHCKTLGDIDGDGFIDAIVASSNGEGMFWYEYPRWLKHPVRSSGSWTTDMQAVDIDDDGDLDLVIPNASAVYWYENPRPTGNPRTHLWAEHLIGASGADNHDVEVADVDRDGDIDVVTRRKGGGGTFFWQQVHPTLWTQVTVSIGGGEGTGLGDLDRDGDVDVAQNGFWSEQVTPTDWVSHDFDTNWPADVAVLVADINHDGDKDIVIAPSESSGRFSWYEASDPRNGPWLEHVIDASVSFIHTFKAADMDDDGDLDLVTGEMHQSTDPDGVIVYVNDGAALSWTQLPVDTTGSHNLRVGDIGRDGDLDIFGANWNDSAPNSAVIDLWENQCIGVLPLDRWERHIIETSLPWKAIFVDGRDVNGDDLPDIVTGGWWYPNPGTPGGTWTRTPIGEALGNMAVVHDFDADGDLDILGTDGQHVGGDFYWASNDGSGAFTVLDITGDLNGGDFLQGARVGQLIVGGNVEVVIAWHNGTSGTSMFSVPIDLGITNWNLAMVSATFSNEQIGLGDIDGDGLNDIHLGPNWLHQLPNGSFETRTGVTLSGGFTDRLELADIDDDGDQDVVIGTEGANLLVWGENQDEGATWVEHIIATSAFYMSMDVGDLDNDGDVDVVAGAHMASGEVWVFENLNRGGSWNEIVVDPGDSPNIDHHDGTRIVDMDLDGDLDIVSIGWTQTSLVLYENRGLDATVGPDITPPSIESVEALIIPTRVRVVFSEALDPSTAENASNYAISGGVIILQATLDGGGETLTLTTSALSVGVNYTLTVNNVEDDSGNVISLDTQRTFQFDEGQLLDGLVGYWPLDDGSGTTAADFSGAGHPGTLINGPTWTSGPQLDFDGIDDYVNVGMFDVGGNAVTLAAWFLADDLANCTTNDCRIFSKADGVAENEHYWMLSTIGTGGGNRLRCRLMTDGVTTTLIATSGELTEREWIHAAAVYDGAILRLYQDGAEVASAQKTGNITANSNVATWIGGNPPSATSRPWHGAIADVRIYGRSLSAEEIQVLATSRSSSPALFLRGECNGDGEVDLSDAVILLSVLFLGQGDLSCTDGCDANDDGTLDLSDAIATLGVLFLGQETLPPPGMGDCGVDPTGDELGCETFEHCR